MKKLIKDKIENYKHPVKCSAKEIEVNNMIRRPM